ncbi:MAG TPA: UTP--glucose-1-phosphate uridylyltransferase GalU [Candidatus Acidoferrales bacterium]|nr:UTP--glucose-1-phosphate uridylyltransferase GalU [Candidatus Acidoferrales bacterium]
MPARNKVRKAVIPVAGLGTRFLPATKSQPKEMLTLVDRPLIQYAVEEAAASGIDEIILVTGPGKDAIEDHFDSNPELERELMARGKRAEARAVRAVSQLANVVSVRQKKPLGLGHAIGCARELVGDEPFAVLLPDEIIDARVPCTQQLLAVHAQRGGCVVATQRVRRAEISSYGVMKIERLERRLFRVRGLVEKPTPRRAPSTYAVVGRYVLEPEIFDLIARTKPGRGGEIQLTDALARYAAEKPMYAVAFDGERFDAGNKAGFLAATLYFAGKHPELRRVLRRYLRKS